MKFNTHKTLICTSLVIIGINHMADAQYGAQKLTPPLSQEQHFQTDQGRDGYRFEGAEINKYRLYDFYQRQAEYHLKQGSIPDLLLPHPGMEGGRRGHWGGEQ